MDFNIDLHTILEYPVGSKLYGTDNSESDVDIAGVFIAPLEYYFGMKSVEEVDMSKVSKTESGKNDKNAIDKKFYEIRRFFKLASDCNPNIVEQLFIPEDQIISSRLGLKIIENKDLFLSARVYHRFLGYAHSQKKKMIVKLEKFEHYTLVKDILEKAESRDILFSLRDELKEFIKDEFLFVGDIKLQLNILNKKALSILNKRFASLSNRTELIRNHGFDTKFASHLIRLTLEGIELLETGNLIFPLQHKEMIKSIKAGNYSLKEILEIFDDLESKMNNLKETTCLPYKPNYYKLNSLLINILQEFHRN